MSHTKLSTQSTHSTESKASTTGKPSPVSKKKKKKVSIMSEHENITIRLSEIGVFTASPSDMELQIQAGRVLYILDKAISKLQVATTLPSLLKHDACTLVRYLTSQEVEFVQGVCVRYAGEIAASRSHLRKCSMFQQMSAVVEKISLPEAKKKISGKVAYAGKLETDTLADPHMGQVMELLWSNHPLRTLILDEYDSTPQTNDAIFVNCIRSLREAVSTRMSVSALDERAREKRLRKAWIINSESEANINATKLLLEKQREELGRQLDVKKRIVNEYTSKIEELKLNFKEDIKRKVQDSEKEMAEDTHASERRQGDLAQEAKTTTYQFETLLSQHLRHEKNLRHKRSKVETQLCSWLNKYDADIGERQAEFEEITRGFDEEKAELDALQEKFNEQEEDYIVLMTEKEEEERKVWEAKAYVFLSNRSARRIQRFWKAYVQRKIERRKAKKAKGKAKKEKSMEVIDTAAPVESAPPPTIEKSKGDADAAETTGRTDPAGVTNVEME
ncbi:hypothetical protein ILUMI_04010 [Ignelater luminosus]|uniref:Dynein regulatory complex protein 10 n=1 Tax=Ignelater luminosus TaxID=2038154 RepID=A0A8K0DF90_IGNLU|nr:hypothetical protein ILUMI_04010 [Ignelater luminosus]